MGRLSTHVLDTANGKPASGVAIELFTLEGEQRRSVVATTTNADGRTDAPLHDRRRVSDGNLRARLPCRRLFPVLGTADGRTAVPGPRADPLHDRGARRALPRPAPRFALELFHLPRQLSMAETSYPRDLVGYGRNPPHPRWPNGARICVQFVINYEEGGENNILHGDRASEAFLSEIVGRAALAGPAAHEHGIDLRIRLPRRLLAPVADVHRAQSCRSRSSASRPPCSATRTRSPP